MAEEPRIPAPRKSRLWPTLVLFLGLAGGGGYVWLRTQPSTGGAGKATAESTLTLETFIVNLNSSGQRGYLRVGITLGLGHPLLHNSTESAPIALVRDTILSVLATAQPEQLSGIEGKRQLKEQLLKALQERAPQMAVQSVYFTEFLVQM